VTSPEVSVVVPTYQRAELLRDCIESFDAQIDAPEFEVVVVDDGSSDDTPRVLAELAADRPWLRFSSQSTNRGPAAARNRALAEATGALALFVDDDIAATPALLRTHVDLHAAADDDRLAILGRVDWHPSLDVTPFMKWLDTSGLQFAYDTWLCEGPVEIPGAAFYTANLSMPRALVVDAGGFDERFPFPAYEDLELAARLTARGLHLDYRPTALAYHRRAIDLATFAKRMDFVGESAELMRTVSPDFEIDDRALVAHRVSRRRALKAAAISRLRPTTANRGRYYWATVAAAYDRGIQRGRTAHADGEQSDG
jgi:glycosyltransferase involved in cell wall biosynthesis